jgi:hypothetical protein
MIRIVPADRLHEGFDVVIGLGAEIFGAEIDVIGVVVPIQRKDRRRAAELARRIRVSWGEIDWCLCPFMRNRLDTSSVAQSLDGGPSSGGPACPRV